jgi:hypothetical protein
MKNEPAPAIDWPNWDRGVNRTASASNHREGQVTKTEAGAVEPISLADGWYVVK